MQAELVADVRTHGPLMSLSEDLADLGEHGFESRTSQRRVSMTVQQMRRLGRLLSVEEIEALALFAEFMTKVSTPAGDQYIVEGFNEAWLKAHGMGTTAARKANSLLKARGLLETGNPDGPGFMREGERSHVSLADRFCGITSAPVTTPLARRRPATRPNRRGSNPAMTENETRGCGAVDNISGADFARTEISRNAPVDNISSAGFAKTETSSGPSTNPQVSTDFIFPMAGTTSSRTSEVSNYPCTGTNGEIESPSLVAFLRDGRLLGSLRSHEERVTESVTAAFKGLPNGQARVGRATRILTFLGQPLSDDPLAQVARFALGLTLVRDDALADTAAGVISKLRAADVSLTPKAAQAIPPASLCVTVAMAIVAATDWDAERPGGWLYRVITGDRRLRHDGAVREFLMTLSKAQAMPADGTVVAGRSDLSNANYAAALDEARGVVWNAFVHAQDDVSWQQFVLDQPAAHQRVLDMAAEIRQGRLVCAPPPENWRAIAAGLVDV